MKIELHKFGHLLVSRPEGREAFLVIRSYLRPKTDTEMIELDFAGVKVMTPSWLDEVVEGLKTAFPNPTLLLPSQNPSVIESIKIIRDS